MKKQTTQEPHKFIVSQINGTASVQIAISEESSLSEVVEQFEAFLNAIGYRLPHGARLGYEWEDGINCGDVHDRFMETKHRMASIIAAVNYCLVEFPSDRASVYLTPIMEKIFSK